VGVTAIGAVILAAGAGTRMGGVAKALLRRGDRSFLATIAATAREVGLVDAVVVVGPPYRDAVAAEAAAVGLRVVDNPRPERGMASSIALGFAALVDSDVDAAWLWPVDHPDVAAASLRALVAALADREVARPVVGDRGGHPPLVSRALWPRLVAGAIARDVIAEADRIDVALDDVGCTTDVDVPEQA
jgi:CTP:molybdopterin cytidylyltransferase MocA